MEQHEPFLYPVLQGPRILLKPLNIENDIPELYCCSHGSPETEAVWYYMPYGPFKSVEEMKKHYETTIKDSKFRPYCVFDTASLERIGIVNFMNIEEAHRRVELGGIWYAPKWQRTYANTETIFLMLQHSFDTQHYRRVEWKCDALNTRSRAAAERLGFKFEGIFRQHMLVKGRNRDTAWFSIIDSEWPEVTASCKNVARTVWRDSRHNTHNRQHPSRATTFVFSSRPDCNRSET